MTDQEKREIEELIQSAGFAPQKKELSPDKSSQLRRHLASCFARLSVHKFKRPLDLTRPIQSILSHSDALWCQYVEEYRQYRQNAPGLAFFGNNGTGKSFAMRLLYEMFHNYDYRARINWIDCGKIVEQWKEDPQRLEYLYSENAGMDIVLDDLGLGMDGKSYGNQCPFGVFLHRRHSLWQQTGRMTHVTSHIDSKEFKFFFGNHALSRIMEMCLVDDRYTETVRDRANNNKKEK